MNMGVMKKGKLDQAGMRVVMPDNAFMSGVSNRRAEKMLGLNENVVRVEGPSSGGSQGYEQEVKELADRVEGCDYIVHTPYGAKKVELKSVKSYLIRDHGSRQPKLNTPCGTVYFEMMNASATEWGWLHHFYRDDDPAVVNIDGEEKLVYVKRLDKLKDGKPSTPAEERGTTYTEPDYLHYLLFRNDETEVVASIAFEWRKLRNRLNELTGGELPKLWERTPSKELLEEIKGRPWADGWIVEGNGSAPCWHVPMDKLADIATVTMIEGKGSINPETLTGREPDRYNWLKDHSKGRTMYIG